MGAGEGAGAGTARALGVLQGLVGDEEPVLAVRGDAHVDVLGALGGGQVDRLARGGVPVLEERQGDLVGAGPRLDRPAPPAGVVRVLLRGCRAP